MPQSSGCRLKPERKTSAVNHLVTAQSGFPAVFRQNFRCEITHRHRIDTHPPNICASSFRTECNATSAMLRSGASSPMALKQQLWRPGTRLKHVNRIWRTCRPTVTRPGHSPTETCGRRIPPTAALSSSALTLGGAGRNEVVICGPPSLRKTHPRGNHGTLARPRQTSKIYAQEHSASIPFAPVCHPVRLQVCLPVAHGRYTQEHLQGKCSRMAPVHYHQGADG